MKLNKKNNLFVLFIVLILLGLWLIALKSIYWGALDVEMLLSTKNIISLSCYLLIHIAFFTLTLFMVKNVTGRDTVFHFLKQNSWLVIILAALSIISPIYIFAYSDWGSIFTSVLLRILFFIVDSILLTYCLSALVKKRKFLVLLFISILLIGCAFSLSSRFRRIIDYPFSLSWSEGNRFWDYSVLFGAERYDTQDNSDFFTLLDFGRQSLWGIIFLLPDITIKLMRLWNDLLYIIPSILLGLVLFKKKDVPFIIALLASLWVFLFLNQGPIYAPIIISLILVVIAVDMPALPGILLIIAAGYYAQLTRYTWSVAPAIWAGLLIMCDPNNLFHKKKERNKYALITIVCGLIGGIILPILIPIQHGIYQQSESQAVTLIDRILSTLGNQELIWSRLLPNNTNTAGILLSIVLATFPTILIVFLSNRNNKQQVDHWRTIYLVGSLVATFFVGIVVSVKIGGGSNLHNFDLFFLTVLLIAGMNFSSIYSTLTNDTSRKSTIVTLLLIFTTCSFFRRDLLYTKPLVISSESIQTRVLDEIQDQIEIRQAHGEILFIDQRQLLTFGTIQAPLIDDYEKKMLMNQALSRDEDYFDQFYGDLKNHRFSLIINEPINITYQDDEASYGEENDAYVKWVSEPLLCYYEPLETFSEVGVELLVPRTSAIPDFLNCP